MTLIRTKLCTPVVADELVERPRLIEKLDRGSDRKSSLVSGPAGYGKTTLAASWQWAMDHPVAWLSLSDDDNDPQVFLQYVVAAIRSVFPNA